MCIANCRKEKVYTDAGNNIEVDVYTLVDSNKLRQWQIRYCNLGEADVDLKEIGKSRPCIIVQTDKYNNEEEATVFVLPLSASPMYNIVSERLVGIRLNGKISILCFNEMKPIRRSCVQNNIIADSIPDEIKEYIMEYYMQRLFGDIAKKKYETEMELTVIPDPVGSISTDSIDSKDARAVSLIDWMEENEFILNPENVSTSLSVENCVYIYKYYEKMGAEPFKNTKAFNSKTFKMAMVRAKKRAGLE